MSRDLEAKRASMQAKLDAIRSGIGPNGPTPRMATAMANLERGIAAIDRDIARQNRRPRREITFLDRERAMALRDRCDLRDRDRDALDRMIESGYASSAEIARLDALWARR